MLSERPPQQKENAKPGRPRKPSGFAYGFGPVSSKWWKFIEVTEITAPQFALYLAVFVWFQNLEWTRPPKKKTLKNQIVLENLLDLLMDLDLFRPSGENSSKWRKSQRRSLPCT